MACCGAGQKQQSGEQKEAKRVTVCMAVIPKIWWDQDCEMRSA